MINKLFQSDLNITMTKPTKIKDNPKTDRRVLERLDSLTQKADIERKKLAGLLNISIQYMGQLMRGERKISINILIELARILDVDPGSLLPDLNPHRKIDFDEYIWNSMKERLDKYLEEKLQETSKKK